MVWRVASNTNGGTITVSANGNEITTANITGTGGWQNWQTLSSPVNLPAGDYALRLVFSGETGGIFNLNWLELKDSFSSADSSSSTSSLNSSSSSSNTTSSSAASSEGTTILGGATHPLHLLIILGLIIIYKNRGPAPYSNAGLLTKGCPWPALSLAASAKAFD